MVLEGFSPERVWHYFEELSSVPRGSGNYQPIIEYCTEFARKHSLECELDEANNILIRKPAFRGYEEAPGVILQGHVDMVCVKTHDRDIDFEKDGITICTDGENVWADRTTLGADNGIAIAFAFAILESKDIPHPALEVLLTVDEEIGLLGATAFDPNKLRGTRFINLDSEEEGVLTISCAGGLRGECTLEVDMENGAGTFYELQLTGLLGGHSGVEIHKGRKNANRLIGRIMWNLIQQVPFHLVSIHGGEKENAIAAEATAIVCIPEGEKENFLQVFDAYVKRMKEELSLREPNMEVILEPTDSYSQMMTAESTLKVIHMLYLSPNGMQSMSAVIPGLVQTSLNMGIVFTNNHVVTTKYSIRSSVASEKAELRERLMAQMDLLGGDVEFCAEYPAWEYREDSPLRECAIKAYKTVYNAKPEINALHAGLECGIFAGKNPNLDCISFGPTIVAVHTVKETMEIASVQRTWLFLLEILKRSK